MRRIPLVLAVAAPAALLAGCGSSSTANSGLPAPSSSAAPSGAPSTSAAPTSAAASVSAPAGQAACAWSPNTSDAGDRKPGLPPATVPATGTQTFTLKTNQGTVAFTVDRAKTPCTAGSFNWLVSKAYFTDTPCHRLTTASIYVLQCGDPTGGGSGGPGYTIPDENLTGATYPAGTVAMANTGSPHTGGSQFFLVYKDTDLPPSYTPFGKITSGLDVLNAIAKGGTDDANGPGDGHPSKATTIKTFTIS